MFKNNPIFFKDLLITLNSKQGKIIIFFFVLIYFIAFLLFLSDIKNNYNFFESSSIGKNLFQVLGIAQLFTLSGLAFFRGLQSFTSEKANKTLDFIKISPLSANKFVLGKFLASISFILLLFIISLPFLAISLVLGGANFSDILIYSIFTISYSSFAVLIGMLISSLSKNNIFSILFGFILIPLLLFYIIYFFGYLSDYLGIDFINDNLSGLLFAIFPIAIFDYVSPYNQMINIFNINIPYIVFHIIIFLLINYFLFSYIKNQYLKFSNKNVKTFKYFETAILISLGAILSIGFKENIFILIFSGYLFIYLFYIFNDKNNSIKEKYSYFIINFIFLSFILFFYYGFIYHTIIILLLIFLFLFSLKDFLQIFFQKIGIGIFNLIYLITLILYFYVIPLISTNLLNIEFKTINSIIKTALYEDGVQKYKCVNNYTTMYFYDDELKPNEKSWNSRKCMGIEKDGIGFYYFLYFIFNLAFLSSIIYFNNTKKD